MDSFLKTEKVYTIFDLNDRVRTLIRDEFSGLVWVCGEIQDLRERAHINLNLVQKDSTSEQIVAQVKAVIFENMKHRIFERIREGKWEFGLKKDIEVKLLCKVDLYVKTGQFSLTVFDLDPIYTLGKIAQSRQKIIEELKLAGVFEKNKTLDIPVVPLKIGLITADHSAAYHDFINELKISGYGFKVFIRDCYMQGAHVEKDVVKGLDYFNCFSQEELDAVVITRGGGSTADLSFFDNKKIAQTVSRLKFPVITALGHQINITIADMAAHTSVKTPTAAAQFLTEKVRIFIDNLGFLQERILKTTETFLSRGHQDLEKNAVKMESMVTRYFSRQKELLLESQHHVRRFMEVRLMKERECAERYYGDLNRCLRNLFDHSKEALKYRENKISLLNPRNVLKRGYSLTMKNKKTVKSVNDLEKADLMETVFYDGNVLSEVKRRL